MLKLIITESHHILLFNPSICNMLPNPLSGTFCHPPNFHQLHVRINLNLWALQAIPARDLAAKHDPSPASCPSLVWSPTLLILPALPATSYISSSVPTVMPSIWGKIEIGCPLEWVFNTDPLWRKLLFAPTSFKLHQILPTVGIYVCLKIYPLTAVKSPALILK